MNKAALRIAVVLAVGVLAVEAGAGSVIYVNRDSPTNGPGTSWSNAYRTIQAGINAATWEDVWVARGTYNERITLKSEIWVYGGFAGNETALSQRPAFPRPDSDPNASLIDGGGSSNAGRALVFIPSDAGLHTAIDGFTIQNGFNDSPYTGDWKWWGGGVHVFSGARATITNCLIQDNYAFTDGGGIYVGQASPTITANHIRRNQSSFALGLGGGIYCVGDGTPVISGNVFEGNRAANGAAVYSANSAPLISGNRFLSNEAQYRGGGVCGKLGAGTISGNTFKANSSSALSGGAIYMDGAQPLIQNNLIADNTAPVDCGGIACWGASPAILNNTIVGNSRAGIWLLDSTAHINNNIVAFNQGGIYNASGASPVLRNNCFHGNTDYDYDYGGGLGPGAGDIQTDPKFVNYAKGDYRIHYESPCRNAGYNDPIGLPTSDLEGQPRVEGPAVDIGADECWSRVIHVSQSRLANDSNNGDSWLSPKRNIQAAINAAAVPDRVWVACDIDGTPYYERITMKPGVSLFGGFKGVETQLSERPAFPRPSPDPQQTTIDAQSAGTAVTIPPDASEYTRLDGFTVTHGDATNGGGLNCTFGSPTIANCTFFQNHAAEGGAIYLQAASPAIENCVFDTNIAVNRGGAIHAKDFCYPLIERCRFTNCQAQNIDGGAVFADGGGPKLAGCVIEQCTALLKGGAVRLWGSDAVLTNNTLYGNTAADGGAVAMQGVAPRIFNNLVARNSSGLYGAGGALPEMYNNNLWDNGGRNYEGVSPGPGDIGEDPQLGAPFYGDFHLRAGSPCINAGTNAAPYLPEFDLDAQGRKNGVVDIGADEYWAGTVYYVEKTGNDSNSGLDPSHPLKTVNAGLGKCIFGDAVLVGSGTYQERVILKRGVLLRTNLMATLDGDSGGTVVTVEPGADAATVLMGFTIQGGQAALGGGINCTDASPAIIDVRAGYNHAAEGGGIYIHNGSPEIKGGWIWANTADNRGGGIHCSGSDSRLVISEVDIFQNSALSGDGGGAFLEGGQHVMRRCRLWGNTSGLAGGGIRGWQTVAEIAGCCLESNTAPYGPGIHLHESIAWLTNNTLKGNTCTTFGGGVDCAESMVWISNNIIALNSAGIYASGGLVVPRNNDVFGNFLYEYWGISAGEGDISADPAFGVGCDILAFSPCINAGWNDAPSLPAEDIHGNWRIEAGIVDIGAHEYPALTKSGDLKQAPDGAPVEIGGMMTTAALPDAFYIERPDRACGIRVESQAAAPAVGSDALVAGQLRTNADGERYIAPVSHSFAPGIVLKPLTMSNRSIGGGDAPGQAGVEGGSGLNNIGMLVRTAGTVTQTGRSVFYLDDGSRRISSGGQAGIRILVNGDLPSYVKGGSKVVATGISSCFRSGDMLYPRVLVRDISEIVLVSKE